MTTQRELSEHARRHLRTGTYSGIGRFGVPALLLAIVMIVTLTVVGSRDLRNARHAEAHGPSMAHQVSDGWVPVESYEAMARQTLRWKGNAQSIASQCRQMEAR